MGGSGRAKGILGRLAVTVENTRLPETETNHKKDGRGEMEEKERSGKCYRNQPGFFFSAVTESCGKTSQHTHLMNDSL